MPADVGEADGRHQQWRQSLLIGRAPGPECTTCFGVVAKHHPEDEDDQSEQRAKHDDGAHVRTPFDASSTL